MQVIEAKLHGGSHDGQMVEVPNTAFLLSVSEHGDAESISTAEAADAIVMGHDLYRADAARLMSYNYVTLREVIKAA